MRQEYSRLQTMRFRSPALLSRGRRTGPYARTLVGTVGRLGLDNRRKNDHGHPAILRHRSAAAAGARRQRWPAERPDNQRGQHSGEEIWPERHTRHDDAPRARGKFWAPVPWMLETAILLQLALGGYAEGAIIAALLVLHAALGLGPGRPRPSNTRRPQILWLALSSVAGITIAAALAFGEECPVDRVQNRLGYARRTQMPYPKTSPERRQQLLSTREHLVK